MVFLLRDTIKNNSVCIPHNLKEHVNNIFRLKSQKYVRTSSVSALKFDVLIKKKVHVNVSAYVVCIYACIDGEDTVCFPARIF